jgi:hypothetical protein
MKLIFNNRFQSKLIWITIYIFIAFSFIFIASENSIYSLIKNPTFYTDIIFSLTLIFGIGHYIKILNNKLDQRFPWFEKFKIRLYKQIAFGIILPFFLAVFLEIIYLKSINISFFESAMLNFEMPLAFIFLVILNLISIVSYLFKNKQKEAIFIHEQVFVYPPNKLEYINVQKGFFEEKVEVQNCAFIMSANKITWLQTFDGEKYRLHGTLDEWEEKLKEANFYRINRQYISSYKAIKSVEQTETRKLKVNFIFPTDEVYISRPNIAKFKLWWKQ